MMLNHFDTKSIKHIEGTNVNAILELFAKKKSIDEIIEKHFYQIQTIMNFDHHQMMDIRKHVIEMSKNGI